MTAVNLHTLSDDALTDHLAAWFNQTLPLPEQRRLMVPTLRELAGGQPVEPERLAALAGVGVEQTIALLRQAAAEWDPSGTRLVGFGLTSTPTPHRLQVHGHTLWTWCAVDAMFFPVLIGAAAQIESPCAATGDLVRIQATPTGVERVDPAGAVVSIVTPAVDLAEVRQAVCVAQNFYRDADAAAPWQAKHPQALLLPVAKVFALYRRAALRVWPQLGAGWNASHPPSPHPRQHQQEHTMDDLDNNYDLAIIGSGGAAFAAAIAARRKGRRMVMIERGRIGGTCVNPAQAFTRDVGMLSCCAA